MARVVVLDTSTLLWWTLLPTRLTEPASRAVAEADELVVSSISLWEIGLKAKRGLIELGGGVREFAKHVASLDRVEMSDVSTDIWLASVELNWDHRDPADRVIVATAAARKARLVTPDERISSFYKEAIF